MSEEEKNEQTTEYKVSVEETGEVSRNVNIEIPRAIYNEQFNRKLSQTASQVKLKGFRPGRAPRAMVAKLFGERIHSDVVGQLVSDAYQNAVSEHSLSVVGYPNINIEDEDKEKDLTVTAAIEIYPDPEIKDYFGLDFSVEVETVAQEELDKRLEQMREHASQVEPLEGRTTAEDGDLVMIDYTASVEGKEFPGSSRQGTYVELGSGKSLDAIEQGIVGMNAGEERALQVEMPENAGEEVAGKTADYSITLKGIYTKVLPELDDELAKKTGLADDLEGLQTHIREQLEREAEQKNRAAREERLFRVLAEQHPFEVPQGMVDNEIRSILFEIKGLDPRQERSYQVDVAQFRDALAEGAEFRVRKSIMISKIIEQEDFSFKDEEVDVWLTEIAEREKQPREEIDKMYGFPNNKQRLKEVMTSERMIDRLLAESTIGETEKQPAAEAPETE